MSFRLFVVLLAAVIGLSPADTDADYCTYNSTLAGMPGGALKEFVTLLTQGVIEDVKGCPSETLPASAVKFYLYTRLNKQVPIELTAANVKPVDPLRPTILLFHGWLCNYKNDKMPELKDAYLTRYDANVIITDWSSLSMDLYSKSFCNVANVAPLMGDFVCALKSSSNVDISKIHFVGHSMGGQLTGLTAQAVKQKCGATIGRITALDPAGPLFQNLPTDRRLDADDAERVDVIHTNMGFMGYYGPCGKTDFFPNCGQLQPGCVKYDNSNILDKLLKTNVQSIPVFDMNCNHIRSLDYMVESIIGIKPFVAHKCDVCPGIPALSLCPANHKTQDTAVMGEDCSSKTPSDKYVLHTNPSHPFAQG